MGEALSKIVSIDAFRAMRRADRATSLVPQSSTNLGTRPSPMSGRSIEHRERMLRFLKTAAAERVAKVEGVAGNDAREVQGRLLL